MAETPTPTTETQRTQRFTEKSHMEFEVTVEEAKREIERGEVMVKNLATGKQESKPREGIAEALANMLYKAF